MPLSFCVISVYMKPSRCGDLLSFLEYLIMPCVLEKIEGHHIRSASSR